jgi:hypothetical protein
VLPLVDPCEFGLAESRLELAGVVSRDLVKSPLVAEKALQVFRGLLVQLDRAER